MIVVIPLLRVALLSLSCFLLSGCLPSGQSQMDEQKEPHFLAGKSRVNALDYKGALESFERALEVNPKSASAHFELGWLSDQKESDPASAIYHYDHYLKLRPNADNAETIRTRILACKQELARTVSLGPVTQTMQREWQQVAEENKRLREELDKLRLLQGQGNLASAPPSASYVAQTSRSSPPKGAVRESNAPSPSRQAGPAAFAQRHTVKAGETPIFIARRYGVKLDALLAANPGLQPNRLQVGQALFVPSP